MPKRKIWEVDIDIVGPISISTNINFKQEKGFDEDQFYSNIILRNQNVGVTAIVTAYADSSEIAKTAALVFLGRMTDILVIDSNIPLILQDHENRVKYQDRAFTTRRFLEKEDFIAAFNTARILEANDPMLLKSIGWYSKGKSSNNTLDSFLAYWNAIEITATKYHTRTERTKSGAINQIYQCFLDYLGDPQCWGVDERWINDMHNKRSRIAHGAEETTAEAIAGVSVLIPKLAEISRKLIYSVLEKQYESDIYDIQKVVASF